jgi:ribonuclease P protein component
LNNKQRYFFRKNDKLKSRKAIDELFVKGNSFSNFPFRVIWLPQNKTAALQVCIAVSSRIFKKAVVRNKLKRLMREAWRQQKNELQSLLEQQEKNMSVFILYTAKEVPEYKFVFDKMTHVVNRLIKTLDAKTEIHT